MRPIVTDGMTWYVCWSVMVVSPARMAEPIEMQFGMLSQMTPGNHALHEGADPHV